MRSGTLDFDRLRELGDDKAVANLVLIKGVGRWTAEAYLTGCEGPSDILLACCPYGRTIAGSYRRSVVNLEGVGWKH